MMIKKGQMYVPTAVFTLSIMDKAGSLKVATVEPGKHYIEVMEEKVASDGEFCKVILGSIKKLFGEKDVMEHEGTYIFPLDQVKEKCQLDVALTMQNLRWYTLQEEKKNG